VCRFVTTEVDVGSGLQITTVSVGEIAVRHSVHGRTIASAVARVLTIVHDIIGSFVQHFEPP
jgi:hypothetical protein